MTETIREEGVWWLPRSPKKSRSSGTLVIEGNDARLEAVIGPLADVAPDVFLAPEVIVGRTYKGGAYTCFNGYYGVRSTSHTGSGVHKEATIHADNLLKGQHFRSPKDAKFKEAVWRYSNLHLWMYDAPPIGLNDDQEDIKVVTSKRGKRGGLWDADIGDGINVANDYTFSYQWKTNPSALNFLHLDGVRIRSIKARPFTEFFPLERRFRALVNLLADCQFEIVQEIFRIAPNGFGEVQSIGRRWAGGFTKREDPRRGVEPVSFSTMTDFSKIVSKWFEEDEKLGTIANLYLFGKQNIYLDSANQFLGVMQAIESFHRTFLPGTFMAEKDYSSKVAPAIYSAIPATLASDFSDRLKAAVKFGYEYSLARRLNEIVALLPAVSVFDKVKEKKFRTRSKDTRNTFTHQINDAAHPPMEGGELYSATLRWREVLLALILQRLELPEATIITAVKRLQAREGTYVTL